MNEHVPCQNPVTHQYVSKSGTYRIEMFLGQDGIVYQRKVGYTEEADAIAETQLVAQLLDDHQLTGVVERLYVCVDVTELERSQSRRKIRFR